MWVAVTGPDAYVLTPAELAMLEEACRTYDELGALEKALRELPDLVVTGSMGQPRIHPLLAEVRAHRTLLAKLTEQLNLPDLDSEGWAKGQIQARQEGRRRAVEQERPWRSVGLVPSRNRLPS